MAVLHRSPWLLPLSQPPLADGALVLHEGRILALGPFTDLVRTWPGLPIQEHPQAVLLPGLINAHCHLELSLYADLARQGSFANFPAWIRALMAARRHPAPREALFHAAASALAAQQAQGVVALMDIGNSSLGQGLAPIFKGRLLACKEYLGLREDSLASNLHDLQQEEDTQICTGHAAYSTHPLLLQALKQRAKTLGQVFSMHTAESLAEQELFRQGTGVLRDFLEELGLWDGSLQAQEGVVFSLHRHGLLDRKTLCVHCVHVRPEEVQLLAATGTQVCLCPGSNALLDVGQPDLHRFFAYGILPALGTDSLASNPELSLWREMRLLAHTHADIAPEHFLRMACLGGAKALGLEQELGTLDVGKAAAVLAVRLPSMPSRASVLYEDLIHQDIQAVQRLDLLKLPLQ